MINLIIIGIIVITCTAILTVGTYYICREVLRYGNNQLNNNESDLSMAQILKPKHELGSPELKPIKEYDVSKQNGEYIIKTKGKEYRSEEGIIWYSYPSGDQAGYDLRSTLENELNRWKKQNKWKVR